MPLPQGPQIKRPANGDGLAGNTGVCKSMTGGPGGLCPSHRSVRECSIWLCTKTHVGRTTCLHQACQVEPLPMVGLEKSHTGFGLGANLLKVAFRVDMVSVLKKKLVDC